jgi:hypothetical protein
MKTYTGYRRLDSHGHPAAMAVTVHEPGQDPKPLDPRRDIRLHSEEFNWGYGGSGPAQLALALAADVLNDDEAAQDVYQRLKSRVVGRLAEDGWRITEEQLQEAIRRIQQERDEGRGE